MNPMSQFVLEMAAKENKRAVEELAGYMDEIASALGITERPPFSDLRTAILAKLAAPLRLGKGPTVEEAAMHTSVGGLWLLGYGGGKWREIVLPSTTWGVMGREAIEPIDAIPLNAARQPCRVGVKS